MGFGEILPGLGLRRKGQSPVHCRLPSLRAMVNRV